MLIVMPARTLRGGLIAVSHALAALEPVAAKE